MSDQTTQEWRIKGKPAQKAFLKSRARFPGFFGGWGTGKTLMGILKGLDLSEQYPGNLGMIVREDYTDLRDSTIADFERYTRRSINRANKEIEFPEWGKSKIMFRHAKELATLENINLGWFLIEQAHELMTPDHFTMLRGRLRRNGVGLRQGIVIANATDENHWLYQLWKADGVDPATFPCFEMSSLDNADILPADTIADWKLLEKQQPATFLRYVANRWGITDDQFILVPPAMLEALSGLTLTYKDTRKLVICDPSQGGDECVINAMENYRITDTAILHERDTMKIAGHMVVVGEKHGCQDYAVDSIGIGAGICDRLTEMKKRVHRIQSGEAATTDRFTNRRSEMWWYTMERIQDKRADEIKDPETRRQLSSVRYKVVNSHKIGLERKEDTKKRLGYSPDRADAYVYGVWATQFVEPIIKDAWQERKRSRETGSAASVWAA